MTLSLSEAVYSDAQVIGSISGSGRITLVDNKAQTGEPTPVDLDLEKVSDGSRRPVHCLSCIECLQIWHYLCTSCRVQHPSKH